MFTQQWPVCSPASPLTGTLPPCTPPRRPRPSPKLRRLLGMAASLLRLQPGVLQPQTGKPARRHTCQVQEAPQSRGSACRLTVCRYTVRPTEGSHALLQQPLRNHLFFLLLVPLFGIVLCVKGIPSMSSDYWLFLFQETDQQTETLTLCEIPIR